MKTAIPDPDTATTPARVSRIIQDLGFKILYSGHHNGVRNNKFSDGIRVNKPAERYGDVVIHLTNRRAESYTTKEAVDQITAALQINGLSVDVELSDEDRRARFAVRKRMMTCRSRDGKLLELIGGHAWIVRYSPSMVYVIRVNDAVDPRSLNFSEPENPQPFIPVAWAEKRLKTDDRPAGWYIETNGDGFALGPLPRLDGVITYIKQNY